MHDLLFWTESIVTFFFLTWTLSETLTWRKDRPVKILSLLIGAAFFALVYKPFETPDGQFWLYWFLMLILGTLYAIVFTADRTIVRFTVCITYLSWITLAKSLISVVF